MEQPKVISHYEKHRLISLRKDNSGYREYSNNDIDVINEISLYRKLEILIKEIKIISVVLEVIASSLSEEEAI